MQQLSPDTEIAVAQNSNTYQKANKWGRVYFCPSVFMWVVIKATGVCLNPSQDKSLTFPIVKVSLSWGATNQWRLKWAYLYNKICREGIHTEIRVRNQQKDLLSVLLNNKLSVNRRKASKSANTINIQLCTD